MLVGQMSDSPPPASSLVPPKRSASLFSPALVAVAAGMLAVVVHGHYLKPHGDFFEFRETGRSLWRGELPDTLRRGPFYPAVLHPLGRMIEWFGPFRAPADQVAAELLNALLLPINTGLLVLLATPWLGPAAAGVGLWFAVLPAGLLLTAHTLVEPLLITVTLLTLLAAARRSRWAYVWAGVTCVTRYDMAAILPGVFAADLLATGAAGGVGRRLLTALGRAALAALPLAIWLSLTALTWADRSHEHYIAQIASRPIFEPRWSFEIVLQTLMAVDWLRVPLWLWSAEPLLSRTVALGLPALALIGALGWVWRRDPAGLCALAAFTGYWLIHAIFPFHEHRFGYPPAPLVLLAAAAGAAWVAMLVQRMLPQTSLAWWIGGIGAALGLAIVLTEYSVARAIASKPGWLENLLPAGLAAAGLTATALVLPAGASARAGVGRRVAAGLLVWPVLAAASLPLLRVALTDLRDGREMDNLVAAARWVRDHADPSERVVINVPGLLRLYAGDEPRGRFLHYEDIAAPDWPGVLDECRDRGIVYLVWHDLLFNEHGVYYTSRWQLERFEPIASPGQTPGIELAAEFPGGPHVWIVRVIGAAGRP